MSPLLAQYSRRRFLELGASGAVLLSGAASGARTTTRQSLTIDGQNASTIDAHAHCSVYSALAFLPAALRNSLLSSQAFGVDKSLANVSQRLRDMDAMGIDMQVLSINPFWYGFDRSTSQQIVHLQNHALAQLIGEHHTRFAAFASVSLQFPDLAVDELDYAVRKLGLRGAAIGANVGDLPLSDKRFNPVWTKASELGATIYIHPGYIPKLDNELRGNGYLKNVIGLPLSSTIALSHLIFEGTLDKFPRLKLLVAHAGGYLPSYPDRQDHGCSVSPSDCDPSVNLRKKPSEYLRNVYFDNLIFTSEGLRHLIAEVGVSQIVLGSDYPYPWVDSPIDVVMKTPALSNQDRVAILGGNARRLLDLV